MHAGHGCCARCCSPRRHSRRAPTRSCINGKIVTLDAAGTAEALAVARRQDRRDRKDPTISRKLAGPATRTVDLGGPHRHSRPDQLAHACDPRGAVLCHRGELDRRQVDPRGDGAHRARRRRPPSRANGSSWRAAGRRRSSPRSAARRRPSLSAAAPDNPVYIQLFYSGALLTPAGFDGAEHHQRRGRAAARQARARRGRQARTAGSRATIRRSRACSTSCRCRPSSRAWRGRGSSSASSIASA